MDRQRLIGMFGLGAIPVAGIAFVLTLFSTPGFSQPPTQEEDEARLQARLLSDIRQLTFTGARAGEGYFSQDGRKLVFQSEREPGNPFFQIYLMDRETGDTSRISPGIGKTTCAWIHPDNQRILFASTQYDPAAMEKQRAEIAFRQSGQSRRYSWDYDEHYELVEFDLESGEYRRLTDTLGYDAEGSYSPDGRLICFASNRRAYTGELSDDEQALFEKDPASAIDLYLLELESGLVRRLTDHPGYDGGPFFSPDGQQIVWRRFNRDGSAAELMLMNVDGSDQRQLTNLGAVSWAPFFHPSGKYLIFATNLQGFGNFELYLIDLQGNSDPVRVTYREGFDGLPAFSPDGSTLVWTSNAGSAHSQLYEAAWNHRAACELLGLQTSDDSLSSAAAALQTAASTQADIRAADIGRHVDYLCRPELGGRLTGTAGELQATAYVAAYLEHLGFQPAGVDGGFFQPFEFVSGVCLGTENKLIDGQRGYTADHDWRPLSFSRQGAVEAAGVVFAGYGIVAPASEGQSEYDSYVHLDVQDKWVLVFRYLPQDISPERRQYLAGYSHDRYKAMMARERGARGIILVSGPRSQFKSQLIPLRMDGSLGSSTLAAISVADAVADQWLEAGQQNLAQLQQELDSGDMMMGFPLEGVQLSAQIDVAAITGQGRNVLARLPAASSALAELIVIGAHIDHLGEGTGSSLAKESELGAIHRGADDNASGVACVLEVAEYLIDQVRSGRLDLKRDLLVAAWSGEELGLRGSSAFVEDFYRLYPDRALAAPRELSSPANSSTTLYPTVAACLNLDMVGRLREALVLQGIGSSPYWTEAIERRNAVVGLPLVLQADCHLPTDATSFFLKGVPILSAFTGAHDEYHTPRDVPELLNYDGAARVARLMALLTRELLQVEQAPLYQDQPVAPERRANLAAYLGTVPDYVQTDLVGVKLSGVTKGAPAEQGGLKAGDVIVELAGRKIENIYDYTYAIEALKVGQPVTIKVRRGEESVDLEVVPASRN